MTFIRWQFCLLTLIGAGFGVVHHSSFQVGQILGGAISASAGLIGGGLLALVLCVGFILVTDKPWPWSR